MAVECGTGPHGSRFQDRSFMPDPLHEQKTEAESSVGAGILHILHADLDAFYAAVEQLDNPELRGKAVLVGGRPESRGVVATASYEAREYGVHSAMPMRTAARLCPHGTIVRPRFDRYREESQKVMAIFRDLTDLVEPLSLDEAYLDISESVEAGAHPLAVAIDLKRRVNSETGLTLSVGVGTSKSVAKIASDLQKPDGLVVVPQGEEREFLAPLPVGRLWGIGPKTVSRLKSDGIDTIGQLADKPMAWFQRRFGQRAAEVLARALGQDFRSVHTHRVAKSISAETTFAEDIKEEQELYEVVSRLSGRVARELASKERQVKTVTLKARLADFTTFTRQTTLPLPTRSEETIQETARTLLSKELGRGRAFRLLGVGVSGFAETKQIPLPLVWDTQGEED